ncbi:MAG: hypothetical protein A2046_06890 [Bacteroidetes bacterium GWA2_30_7]|nr:MAG: hypothetical protein A2046_06890 [Bacteroidetes bacterium GWA2_30_7]
MKSKDRKYTNGEITVFWKPALCDHSTICFRKLPKVFNPIERPWVNINGEPTNKIIEIVDLCPTQALSYMRNKDIKNEADESVSEKEISSTTTENVTVLTVMKDGPLKVKGNFKIVEANGNTLEINGIATICRCGASSRKPFCDGKHREINYKD